MASILWMQNSVFEGSFVSRSYKVISIWILIFEVSIVLLKLLESILSSRLSNIVVIRTILVLNLIEPISSIACVSSISKCFWSHHVFFYSIDLVITGILLLMTCKLEVAPDLEL